MAITKERLEQLIDKNGELVMGKFRSIDDVFNDLRDKSDEYKKIDNISNIVNNLVEDIVKSLEQHEAEIRKPLEDEIVKLNEFIARLISGKEPETAGEITERYHREIMLKRQNKFLEEEVERLKKESKQLIKDNKLLDNTKYTAQQDDIDFFVSEERQKVIAELEEWVDGYDWWMQDGVIYIVRKDLRQKLNDMKGE